MGAGFAADPKPRPAELDFKACKVDDLYDNRAVCVGVGSGLLGLLGGRLSTAIGGDVREPLGQPLKLGIQLLHGFVAKLGMQIGVKLFRHDTVTRFQSVKSRYLPLSAITYGDLSSYPYNQLSPCTTCSAPERPEVVAAWNSVIDEAYDELGLTP